MFGVGTGGLVFWLFFTKLNCTYTASNIPKYNHEDIADHVQPYLEKYITANVTFESVYRRRKTAEYVPLEEAFFDIWNWNRCVCIGDSVHKVSFAIPVQHSFSGRSQMTPNLGQGANSAIETAAILANCLSSMLDSNAHILPDTISRTLDSWASFRKKRMKNISIASREWTRVATFTTPKYRLIALYIIPYFGDHFANLVGHIVMRETIQFYK